ncbi:gliding motility-associated C-terminal domain-containing protein [Algoriphagus aquatilis]|uniref:Gliding motility-associated C-terminal domain-containing protein n=1 Tax=Algoriphagus aquatilis TaxID=490186 RepID=A0ABW0BWQ4_9BACT
MQKSRVFFLSAVFLSTLLFVWGNGWGEDLWKKNSLIFKSFGTTAESNNLPKLSGPELLCNAFGSVLASYSGGGNPVIDIYKWEITDPFNSLVFDRLGGATFQEISFTFSQNGKYTISLTVIRGGIEIHKESKSVEVIQGPSLILNSNYSFCEGENIKLTAIDPSSTNFSKYSFEWYDDSGKLVSSQNTFSTDISGKYTVTLFILDLNGNKVCETQKSTQVSKVVDYTISVSKPIVCPDLPTNLSASSSVIGNWTAQKSGSPVTIALGYGNSINVVPNQQLTEGEGTYTITFTPDPSINPSCLVKKSLSITYNPQPDFLVYPSKDATDCDSFNGTLTIEAVTDLDYVVIEGLGISTPSISSGQSYVITGLKSGTYNLTGVLGSCSNGFGSIVPLENPPTQLLFTIENIVGETCLPDGKSEGSFVLKFDNPPSTGSYKIINQKGTLVKEAAFTNVSEIPVSIPGGVYFVEVLSPNDCNIPESQELQIPSLTQSQFSVPSELTICQSYELIPQTNQNLEFTIVNPSGISQTKPKGTPFTIDEEGEYLVIGKNLTDPTICPSQSKFVVKLVDPIAYEPKLIDQDCFGNRTYEADIKGIDPNTVKFQWFNEKNELVGTGQFLNPVSNGLFKLNVQPINSEACPIPPTEFEIKEPILFVDVNLSSTKLCEFGPRAILSLTTTFPEEITDVEWRKYDVAGNIEELPQFKNKYEVTVDEEGIYEASVFSRIPSINKNCELGRSSLQIDLVPNKVTYTIPGDLSLCDPFELLPIGSADLEYILTYPDGSQITKPTGDQFILDQAGNYTILGYNPDVTWPLCPEQKEFTVTFFEPVVFEPELVDLTCEGTYTYQARINNYDEDEVDFFWRNSTGVLVSTNPILLTNIYGEFSLEVQPKGSLSCSDSTVPFTIPIPILEINTQLISETLCPDQPNAAIKVNANFESVQTIQWWYTDLSNNTYQLTQFTNREEILATQEATYEVRLINSFGCVIGSANQLVIRSTDQIRPQLESSYQVCPRYEIGPTLNPGNFSSYEWYFEGNLVSTSSSFKPLQVGVYEVIVFSQEGCAYQTSFVTEEECELKLRLPNALQPGDPEKQFLIYTNYLVDELEVWIFNKWGNLIFHCKNSGLIDEESTCLWDVTYQGEKVPQGVYSYRINYKNLEKNIQKTQLGSLLILD